MPPVHVPRYTYRVHVPGSQWIGCFGRTGTLPRSGVFDTNGDEELSGANQIYRGSVSLLIRRLKSNPNTESLGFEGMILLYRVMLDGKTGHGTDHGTHVQFAGVSPYQGLS
jgi:hypothetical protein